MNTFFSKKVSRTLLEAGESTKRVAQKVKRDSINNLNKTTNAMGLTLDEGKLRKQLQQPLRHSGCVWKRRGGLLTRKIHVGNLIPSAWEERRLELRGTVLFYYDTDQSSLSIPRGILDLKEKHATVQASLGQGTPSPFCLSVKLMVGLVQETKWKLCWNTHAEQQTWLSLLSQVVTECSVDAYNHVLLEALNPQHPNCAELNQWVRQPPSTYNYDDSGHRHHQRQTRIAGGGHELWMTLDEPPKTALPSGEETKEEDDDDASSFYTANTKISVNELLLVEKEKEVKALRNQVQRLNNMIGETKTDCYRSHHFDTTDSSQQQSNSSILVQQNAFQRMQLEAAAEEEEARLQAKIQSLEKTLDGIEKEHQNHLESVIAQLKLEKYTEQEDSSKELQEQIRVLRCALRQKKEREKLLEEQHELSLLNTTTAMMSIQTEMENAKKRASEHISALQTELRAKTESHTTQLEEQETLLRTQHEESLHKTTAAIRSELTARAEAKKKELRAELEARSREEQHDSAAIQNELDSEKQRASAEKTELQTKIRTLGEELEESLRKQSREHEQSLFNATTAMMKIQKELAEVKQRSTIEKKELRTELEKKIRSLETKSLRKVQSEDDDDFQDCM